MHWLLAFTPLLALLLDRCFGEPQRAHPLVFLGRCIDAMEKKHHCTQVSFVKQQWYGFVAAMLIIVPVTAAAYLLSSLPVVGHIFAVIILYGCVGLQSLREHATAIAEPLLRGDIVTARQKVAMIVSRDSDNMDETQIARASIESILENGNDAVFATLFWFFVLGAPGAVLLRVTNTLDAMWGYKTERYLHFGRFAARLDDVMNWLPARLTALTFAMLGNTQRALHCWRTQAALCASPNGGPVMTAGAGALQLLLGGGASYHGVWQEKTLIGEGKNPHANDIARALQLVQHGAGWWVALFAVFFIVGACFSQAGFSYA
jgi:adenosylcobinamide-phosphate synthase